jgi:hypothetical protein
LKRVAILVALSAISLGSSGPASASSLLACGRWTVVPSPNAGSGGSVLSGVAAVSKTDAWAVGSSFIGGTYRTLAERWDGSVWNIVQSPNQGNGTNTLTAVTAVSSTDVWAVGFYDDGSSFRTLALHWDGSSWSIVPTPNVGTGENALTSIATVSSTDVWAVGYHQDPTAPPRITLALHWNGSSWSVVSTPNVGTNENFLWSVSARSPSDVWAVGSYSVPWFQTLTEHWDGTSWTVVPSPNLDDGDNVLYAAVALGPHSAVAVGNWLNGNGDDTLGQYWDGTEWAVVPTPSPGDYLNFLTGVAADGSRDIWAVGWGVGQPFGATRTLSEHWNGTEWSRGKTVDVGDESNALAAVAGVPGTNRFWAVGNYEDNSTNNTLIEFGC